MKTKVFLSLAAAFGFGLCNLHAGFFGEIKDDLVNVPSGDSPKYTALYFSAHWCPPCRMFTPKLVEWYKEFKKSHPNFELVFVSADKDAAAMEEYMKSTGMPWPAVKFDKARSETFGKFGSDGIPYLVLIGEDGKPLTAKPGNEWQPPQQVLQQIEKIVGAKS